MPRTELLRSVDAARQPVCNKRARPGSATPLGKTASLAATPMVGCLPCSSRRTSRQSEARGGPGCHSWAAQRRSQRNHAAPGHPRRPDQSTPLRAGLLSLEIYDGELCGADAARLCLDGVAAEAEAAVAMSTPIAVATPIAASWDAWGGAMDGVPVVAGMPLVGTYTAKRVL